MYIIALLKVTTLKLQLAKLKSPALNPAGISIYYTLIHVARLLIYQNLVKKIFRYHLGRPLSD